MDSITRAMTRVTDNRSSTINVDHIDSFVDYQTRMVSRCKEIAQIAQEMVTKSNTDSEKIGKLSADLAKNYAQLAGDSIGAATSTSNADVSTRIRLDCHLCNPMMYHRIFWNFIQIYLF